MNVANILPGDEIRTELQYTELLTRTEGVYEFVYPTVVGPRYSNESAVGAPAFENGLKPLPPAGGSPHLRIRYPGQTGCGAAHPGGDISESRDLDPLRGSQRGRGIPGPDGKVRGQPGLHFEISPVGKERRTRTPALRRPGREFLPASLGTPKTFQKHGPSTGTIFVVDVSGSMHGFPLDTAKGLLKDLLSGFTGQDLFNVLLFSGGSQLLSERSQPATPENVRRAMELIGRQQGGGGTELLPALERAMKLPTREGTARTLVIVTDGFVSVEAEVFDLIRSSLGKANVFSFGIGSSVNRHLIEGMARVGLGEPFIVTTPEEAPRQAERFRRLISTPLLTQLEIEVDGFQVGEVEPPQLPDVFAERP